MNVGSYCVITVPRKGNPHTLKPFKKGIDSRRNTKGQPKKLPRLDQLLADCIDGEWMQIIKALVTKAKRGDIRAAEVLLDRAYGKPKFPIGISEDIAPDPSDLTSDQEDLLKRIEARLAAIDKET